MNDFDYDYVVIGSGFGGSVAALRLIEKGHRVLLLEKGRELSAQDFPTSNWNLKRWLWMPRFGFHGLFRIAFFPHVTILAGVGVGGGSLVYACTHPVPPPKFFSAPSWAHLADWGAELPPHYATARRMLGVATNPTFGPADELIRDIAKERGQASAFGPTDVAIYFGEPGKTVPDPYFGGAGPARTGCIHCGGCMLGCRHDAKNSLDKNYLHLARQRGLDLRAETDVVAVRPLPGGGYRVEGRTPGRGRRRDRVHWRARNVVFAGGVLGTLKLLLRMKDDPNGLPRLSERLGHDVRTNSESLVYVVSQRRDVDLSRGLAIGSILQTDEHSHLEPVRYPKGSGAFRPLLAPHVPGDNAFVRMVRLLGLLLRNPLKVLRAFLVPDLAKYSSILLYMRTSEGTLRFVRSRFRGITTRRGPGAKPTASLPDATELARAVAEKLDGMPLSAFSETLFNIPTTAHILGGCCMGDSAETGVIDARHRVYGYDGLYVIDGSAVSANPGVNPALTIVALAERALSFIPEGTKST